MKTQILKITLIALSTLLPVNICKAQQYITSNATTGYTCYNFFDNNTAANITPTPVGSTTAAIILPAAGSANLSTAVASGSCLESNKATLGVPAVINYIPASGDQTTYAANLNSHDWEWSLLYKATASTGQSAPTTGAPGGSNIIYTPLVGTSTNAWRYWLMATSASVATAKGFVLMQTSDGYLHVYACDGNSYDAPYSLLTSKAPLTPGTTYTIKIQRLLNNSSTYAAGVWNMYLDTYSSTITQAQTLQQTNNTDYYTNIIQSPYTNSFLEATQTSATAGTFKWDEMHMYTRYLVFNPITSVSQGVTAQPYTGGTNAILYGLQILMRGNYDFTQIYITDNDVSSPSVRSNFGTAELYKTTSPILSISNATAVSPIQLNNGAGATAQITAYTDPFVSSGNIDGTLSNPDNYFIYTHVNTTPTTGTLSFGAVTQVVDGTTSSPVPTGNYSNGASVNTWDWKGGSGSGSTLNSWGIAANWVQNNGNVPATGDIVNFGVNYNFTSSPALITNITIGQVNVGKNGGNPVIFNLFGSSKTATTLTVTNGLIISSGATLNLTGKTSTSPGIATFTTNGTSVAAPLASIVPTDVNFVQNGTFTLQSDATGSANIGIYNGATITGTFNVQRYFTAERTWRLLSSPIYNSTGTFNFSNLQQNMIVTGSGGAASGFDPPAAWATGYTANGPTVLFYNEPPAHTANADYTVLATNPATTTANVGTGFYFYYRGDRINNLTNKLVRNAGGTYATPEATQGLWTGSLTTGNVNFAASYTAHSGETDDGYNIIGNPYACLVDWTKVGFTANKFVMDPSTSTPVFWAYDPTINSVNPAGVGNVNYFLATGQGVFVQALATGGTISFTESSKDIAGADQPTVRNGYLDFSVRQPVVNAYMQFEMIRDSANADFAKIVFNNKFDPKFNRADDINDIAGNGQTVLFGSMTADSVEVALNGMPLIAPKTSFFLSVNATTQGAFSIKRTDLVNISSAYDVILMDHFTGDSLDLRQNDTYSFNITSDAKSFGNSRFEVILRTKSLPPYKLLAFTGQHVSDGNQLNWKTQNEYTYTTFQLQKSTDAGKTFSSIATMQSDSSGQYTYTDKNVGIDTSMYRLMQSDLNNNVTYSSIVIISTTGSLVDFKVYPNPASSYIQFQANSVVKPPLKLNIYNSIGSIVKSATFSSNNGTQDLSGLINGTYILEIIDVGTKKSLGTAKFSKF